MYQQSKHNYINDPLPERVTSRKFWLKNNNNYNNGRGLTLNLRWEIGHIISHCTSCLCLFKNVCFVVNDLY